MQTDAADGNCSRLKYTFSNIGHILRSDRCIVADERLIEYGWRDCIVLNGIKVFAVIVGGSRRRCMHRCRPNNEPIGLQVVQHQFGDDGGQHDHRGHHCTHHTHQKCNIIPTADAMIQPKWEMKRRKQKLQWIFVVQRLWAFCSGRHLPFTMMIELSDTLIAHAAMFGAIICGFYVAQMASSILNDMGMFRAIEFGHDACRWALPQFHIGRINEQRCQVCARMNAI